MKDDPRNSTVAPLRLNRRKLVQGGATAGLAAALPARTLSASDRKIAWSLWQQENPGATPVTVEEYVPIVLSNDEWTTLIAVVDRLFPKTDKTPSGAETGAHIYIDQVLSTHDTNKLPDYRSGLAAIEASIDDGFAAASADAQDDALRDIEAGLEKDVPIGFFKTLLSHTRQGMFGDPIHGGNREFMGWDMIGYPGIKLVWSAEDQSINADVEPEHISVVKYGGTPQ